MYGSKVRDICLSLLLQGERSLENLRSTYFDMKDNVFKQQSKIISQICNTDALEETIKECLALRREWVMLQNLSKLYIPQIINYSYSA